MQGTITQSNITTPNTSNTLRIDSQPSHVSVNQLVESESQSQAFMSQLGKDREGSPTKYKSEYCDMVIEHMAQGYSLESFAGVIGVAKSTLYEWQDKDENEKLKFPEFSDAVKIGFAKCQLFWERLGTRGAMGLPVRYKDKVVTTDPVTGEKVVEIVEKISGAANAAIFIFNMKNRFGWRDKQEISGDSKQEPLAIRIVSEEKQSLAQMRDGE